jgi:putative transposase
MRLLACELSSVGMRMPDLWSLVNSGDGGEGFWSDLSRQNRRMLKVIAEASMQQWREQYVKVRWHQADPDGRVDQCNGYYVRKSWPTVVGPLENVRVPRCRHKGLNERMKAKIGDGLGQVAGQVTEMLIAGVSTRRVGPLLERIIGLPVSAGAASELARKLDAEAAMFHSRPVKDDYVYLRLDGIHLKARGAKVSPTRRRKFKPRKRIVLVAYGVTAAGVNELIAYTIVDSESADACGKFLWNLYHRGLHGSKLKLIVSDRGGGLTAAAEEVWPMAPKQACWFHKIANVLKHFYKDDQPECMGGLRAIYAAANGQAARSAWREWSGHWRRKYPKAVACVQKDLERLLAVYALPKAHWKMMRTTNAIERCFREVRRRTDAIGTFLDDASINRLVYGLFAYLNARRAGVVCKAFKKSKLAA